MSSNTVLRSTMAPVVRGWRVYFAPVNRTANTPTVFDPARDGLFGLDAPPAPWVDAGWVDNLKRVSSTGVNQLRAGANGAPTAQFRTDLGGRVELDFKQWGKLQMALAGGGEHLNVLAEAASAQPAPSGGTAVATVAVQAGCTASEIVVGAAAAGSFAPGDLIAVDVDYTGQTGYVGTGATAAYVKSAAGIGVDYIRRVTFNVGRVIEVTGNSVKLAQSLPGGVPAAGAKVQKVVAFADREGSSFFQEWSALLVLAGENGGRICFYYPRLQPCSTASEQMAEISGSLQGVALHAAFVALPYTDPNDNETVLCWRSYFPADSAALY